MANEAWIKKESLEFSRTICHSICFDGVVKLYELGSSENKVNLALSDKLFLDFYILTEFGIFLRKIESPSTWPLTKLVYFDLNTLDIVDIYVSNSSYQVWKSSRYAGCKLKISMEIPITGEEHGVIINEYSPYELSEF